MARLVGVDLPREKRVEIALTYIFGVGRTRAQRDPRRAPASTRTSASATSPTRTSSSCATGSRPTTGSRVTCAARCRPTSAARSRSAATRACGTAAACPVHGQRTHTNARTRKGPRTPSPARRRSARSSPRSPARCQAVRPGPTTSTGDLQHMPPKSRHGAGAKKVRRKEKKNVAHGHAHIKSTFNNTIVSITDPTGQRDRVGLRRPRRLQGLAQVDAVRRADGRRVAPPAARRSTACARSTCS